MGLLVACRRGNPYPSESSKRYCHSVERLEIGMEKISSGEIREGLA